MAETDIPDYATRILCFLVVRLYRLFLCSYRCQPTQQVLYWSCALSMTNWHRVLLHRFRVCSLRTCVVLWVCQLLYNASFAKQCHAKPIIVISRSLCLAGADVTDWGRRLQILLKLLADFTFAVNMLHSDAWIQLHLRRFHKHHVQIRQCFSNNCIWIGFFRTSWTVVLQT